MVGINDVASGSSLSEILQTAKQTVDAIEAELPDTQFVLCDILPSPQCSLNVIQEVNDGFAEICEGNESVSYLPLM